MPRSEAQTNADRILAFLEQNPNPYCDDCISKLCGVSPRNQVNGICNLKIRDKLVSQGDICHTCNRDKLTRQLKENAKPRKEKVLSKEEILAERYYHSIKIGGYDFRFLQELRPETGKNGKFIIERPQDGSKYEGVKGYNRYGNQDFCVLNVQEGLPAKPYVYALTDGDRTLYIGEIINLNERFGVNGYKKINARKCISDGQPTNCKINALILKHYQDGKKIYFYACPIDEKKLDDTERELIKKENPPWNGKIDGDNSRV